MCVIIEKPVGATLDPNKIINACDVNDDGFGYMYIDPITNKMVVKKVLVKDAATAADKLNKLFEKLMDVHVMFHLRFATHGLVNLDNCHPFPILTKEKDGRDIYMMHNGVISIKSGDPEDKDKSDTALFAEYIVRPILKAAPELLHTHAFNQLCQEYTTGSRLLFLDEDGRVVRTGNWSRNEDCIVSNNNYFTKSSYSRGGNSSVTSYSGYYDGKVYCYARQQFWDQDEAVTFKEWEKLTMTERQQLKTTLNLVSGSDDKKKEMEVTEDEADTSLGDDKSPIHVSDLFVDMYMVGTSMKHVDEIELKDVYFMDHEEIVRLTEDYPDVAAELLAESVTENTFLLSNMYN